MKITSREEYGHAVTLARAAIRAHADRSGIRADLSPQAMLAKIKAKIAKGEKLNETDSKAILTALAKQEGQKKRGRGRPKGTRDNAALGALRAAIWAVQESALKNPYRNNEGPPLSQCDAISDAMKAEGLQHRLSSYDAAKREMMAHRRSLRNNPAAGAFRQMARIFSQAFQPIAPRMEEMARTMSNVLDPSIQRLGASRARAEESLRAAMKLSPEALQAIEKNKKTKR